MKKQNIIVLSTILIIGLLIGCVVLFSNQAERLTEEINEINTLSAADVIDEALIYEKLEDRVTFGDYAEVEDAIKTYLKDVLPDSIALHKLVTERMANLVSTTTFETDGPDFEESRKTIEEIKKEMSHYQVRIVENLAKDKVMSYIEGKEFDENQENLYIELVYGATTEEQVVTKFNADIQVLMEDLDIALELYDFLEDNQNAWLISDGNVVFEDINLVEEYNDIIGKI